MHTLTRRTARPHLIEPRPPAVPDAQQVGSAIVSGGALVFALGCVLVLAGAPFVALWVMSVGTVLAFGGLLLIAEPVQRCPRRIDTGHRWAPCTREARHHGRCTP